MKVGRRVRAEITIIEETVGADHVHATRGDMGTVVYIDERGDATVRFDRTGSATVVAPREVVIPS